MSKKAAVGRALLKLLKWAGVTLAREGVDRIVEKNTTKPPDPLPFVKTNGPKSPHGFDIHAPNSGRNAGRGIVSYADVIKERERP